MSFIGQQLQFTINPRQEMYPRDTDDNANTK